MSKTKFTKGEWFVALDGFVWSCESGAKASVKVCSYTVYELETSEQSANAYLIAAAPEMYAELKEVSRYLNRSLGMGDWHKDIEKLLAKARGECSR